MTRILMIAGWGVLLASMVTVGLGRLRGREWRVGRWGAGLSLSLLFLAWGYESVRTGLPAFLSLFHLLLFLSVGLIAAWLLLRPSEPILLFLAWALASLALSPLAPPPSSARPILVSAWLVLHVTTTAVGEVLLLAGAVLALRRSSSAATTSTMDGLLRAGYGLFTLGALVFGAVWAFFAWGRFWGWDPKETWSLIVWLWYTAYLHLPASLRRRTPFRLMPVVGAFLLLFTLVGVPFLFRGLHSY